MNLHFDVTIYATEAYTVTVTIKWKELPLLASLSYYHLQTKNRSTFAPMSQCTLVLLDRNLSFSCRGICLHWNSTKVCAVFIFSLRPLDVEFMKALHEKVNIVPVLAKADTLTPMEVRRKKIKARLYLPSPEKFHCHPNVLASIIPTLRLAGLLRADPRGD